MYISGLVVKNTLTIMKLTQILFLSLVLLTACQSDNQAASSTANNTEQQGKQSTASKSSAETKGKVKNGWELDRLRGKVKKITDQRYYAEQGKSSTQQGKKVQEEDDQISVYDELGHILENTRYDYTKKVTIKKTFKYDGDKVIETKEFEVKKGFTTSEKLVNRYVLNYDEKGNNTQVEWYTSNDSLKEKQVSNFDKFGNKIGELRKSPDDNVIARSVFDYDSNANIIETNNYSGNDKLFNQGLMTYDAKNNKTEERWLYPQSKVTVIRKFTYDANGNIASMDSKIEGPNPKGNAHQEFRYEYDKKGNWVKQILTLEGEVQGMTIRTIEYFD